MTLLHTSKRAVELVEIAADARDYVAASRAENTTRVYRTGWAQFSAWCDEHGVTALPAGPETVACYVADLAKAAKPATIDLRLAAISAAHRAAGHDSPTKEEAVRLVRRGVRRTLGTAQRQVRPVTVPDLRAMVEGLGTDPAGCRERALILLGFAGALRRSELVGLDLADIREGTDGLTVRLRHSKTDQEGAGRTVGIPYGSNPITCPVRAWCAWLEVSAINEGHAFRPIDRHGHIGATRLNPPAVALVLKRHAAQAGLDPGEVAGHLLRAGLATSAAAAGVPGASSPSRRAIRARRCFAVTSARAPCSVRTAPARLGCRKMEAAGGRAGHGKACSWVTGCIGRRRISLGKLDARTGLQTASRTRRDPEEMPSHGPSRCTIYQSTLGTDGRDGSGGILPFI